MKILLAHNSYQQAGGEDAVVGAEAALLGERGHRVITYGRSNKELDGDGLIGRAVAGLRTTWSTRSYREFAQLLKKEKPDVAHFHNIFPLISPAAYYPCADAGVPVIQTLHNYRLLCPAAAFLRDGKVCESCLGRAMPWPGVLHGCYRGGRAATTAVAAMSSLHHAMRTWEKKVNLYIALSEFARNKFVAGGLPSEKIIVKPNFVMQETGIAGQQRTSAVYIGRLSEEKGVRVLIEAWKELRKPVPLGVVGDGPLREEIEGQLKSSNQSDVRLLGRLSPAGVRKQLQDARFLIQPSICFENFPMTIAEAFACGLPVIASRLGSIAEIVQDEVTGLHFEPGNAQDLAAKVEWAWNHPEEMARMGHTARAEYEAKYTPEINYKLLMEIYHRAMDSVKEPVAMSAPVADTRGN